MVYAVEFSHRSGRDLINMAKKRTNVVPIIEDARHPHKYRMLVPMVDTIFADVAQPDQARIVAVNAHHFLKNGGNFVISIKVREENYSPVQSMKASPISVVTSLASLLQWCNMKLQFLPAHFAVMLQAKWSRQILTFYHVTLLRNVAQSRRHGPLAEFSNFPSSSGQLHRLHG